MSQDKIYISYDCVHKLCQKAADQILSTVGKPDVIVAIGGGGFIPSRIIRTFLRHQGEKNIPIQAIGLSLYEDLGTGSDSIGKEVIRTQWLDFGALAQHFDSLIGKNILIVDEVDESLMNGGMYLSGEDVPDKWIAYPWESSDIDTHTKLAKEQGNN